MKGMKTEAVSKIDWKEVYDHERGITSERIVSSCLTVTKRGKKVTYNDLHFPLLSFGAFVASIYTKHGNIRQDYTLDLEMDDGSKIPVIRFRYKDGAYEPELTSLKGINRYGISKANLLSVMLIIKKGYCVYRYVDASDGIVKYIGITKDLYRRSRQHEKDKLAGKNWEINFIDGLTETEAKILESHFISKYDTGKYYNKAKTLDGMARFLDIPETQWRYYVPSNKWLVI